MTKAGPVVLDGAARQAGLDALRVREKAHAREGDAFAAAAADAGHQDPVDNSKKRGGLGAAISLAGPHSPAPLVPRMPVPGGR
jgi:hypothetical protein